MTMSPTQLKVMTFNIRYGTANDGPNSWQFRREAALAFLKHCGCDVIGLQEVLAFQLAEIKEAAPWYEWVGVAREDGDSEGEFAAILFDSRRIECHYSTTFWFSETPDVVASTSWGNELTRICTMAEFLVDGNPFHVYNLHIDHESARSRLKSIEALAFRIHQIPMAKPVVVTGDFNESEEGPAVQRMLFGGFTDTYRVLHPEGPELTSFNGWEDLIDGEKIDYIFTFGGWKILSSEIIRDKVRGRLLSDHYPVAATVELPSHLSSIELHKMFSDMKFPLQNPRQYLDHLVQVASGERSAGTWSDLIQCSHPQLEPYLIQPERVLEAATAVGKALLADKGEEPRSGLSNFNAVTAISNRLRGLMIVPGFDVSKFGKLVIVQITDEPELLSNLYFVELLPPLIRKADLDDAKDFFSRLDGRGSDYVQLVASKFLG